MTFGIPETLATLSLITTAVSTGVSVYGQAQQAESAQALANYNAQIQQNNASLQAQIAQRNATYQAQGAEYSAQAAMAQYQAGLNNAAILAQQARATEAAGREEARRLREKNEAFLSRQRARYAAAGVVGTEGTPLAVLAETAGKLELESQDAIYQSSLKAREYDWRSQLERYNAGFSLLDATMDRHQGDIALWRGEVAQSQLGLANQEADLLRWSGSMDAAGYRMGAVGSLFGGIGDAANKTFNYFDKGVFSKKSTTSPVS